VALPARSDATTVPSDGRRHALRRPFRDRYGLAGGFVLSLHGHEATDAGQRFDEFRPGLDHVGFGCADRGELERLQGRVEELGIEHGGIVEDAVGYALSFRDPDGVALEFWASRS
jgi:catechol-2,3-dioxygenase